MFPKYKKKFIFFKTPDGWENLGKVGEIIKYNKDSKGMVEFSICNFCHSRIRVGKEEGKLFHYCPVCKVKAKSYL